jgi:coenzyme F420-0:L-glutamate ligase/coenzyme F420-1:gamma-L-glutamate ligase
MKTTVRSVSVEALDGIGEIRPGDDLSEILRQALAAHAPPPEGGDALVICQKIVSKAEGRIVRLSEVKVSDAAARLAQRLGKDPAKVALVLRESRRVLRAAWPEGRSEGLLIAEHRLGFVMANAGVDFSNAPPGCAILLPEDPDGSAERIRAAIAEDFPGVGVVITDTFGRPFRVGLTEVAIGVAGMPAVRDLRGTSDASGRLLTASVLAWADLVASAAGLVFGKADGTPAALVRRVFSPGEARGCAADLVRPEQEDVIR